MESSRSLARANRTLLVPRRGRLSLFRRQAATISIPRFVLRTHGFRHDNINLILTPTAEPPGQIGGTGHYTSPRGCTGDFVTTGNATINTIDATFDGIDCDDGIGKGETRHPRRERPVCFQVFSRILALQSAAPFHEVTTR